MNTPTHSASFVYGPPEPSLSIIMIHGYTSSPDEMQELGRELALRFHARVIAPLLPGHGTEEKDLLRVTFDDLLETVRATVRKEIAQGRPYVLIGHSMGGYLALLAAQERSPVAVILTTTPFILSPRFNRPWTSLLMRTRFFWNKEIDSNELEARKHLFFYPRMPGSALSFVKQGIRRSRKILPRITCPILAIYNSGDGIALPESGEAILSTSAHNPLNKVVIYAHQSHGLYYGPHRAELMKDVIDFMKNVGVHERSAKQQK